MAHYYASQYFTTTLSVAGGINDSVTTGIVLNSVAGINDTSKPGIALINYADPLDTDTAEWVTFTSINSTTKTLVGVTRGAEDYAAKSHDNGVTVAFPVSESHVNELAKTFDKAQTTSLAENVGLAHQSTAPTSPSADYSKIYVNDDRVHVLDSSDGVDVLSGTNAMTRQALINGNFDIWQRGTSFTPTSNDLTADRWKITYNADGGSLPTDTISRQSLTPGDISNSFYYLRLNVDGAGSGFGSGAYYRAVNRIEHGARFLCGDSKTVTVSFWAKSDIADKKLGVFLVQNYGSGGSPSSQEVINGEAWTLTSSWTKYTHTFTTNTLSGKTFGTNNDDFLQVSFQYMWSTDFDVYVGETTAEDFGGSGDVDISQVQLCAGSVALPFEPKSYGEELDDCYRYNYRLASTDDVYASFGSGSCSNTTTAVCITSFPTALRADPTVTFSAVDDFYVANSSGVAIASTNITDNRCTRYNGRHSITVASGLSGGNGTYFGANNKTTAWINYEAEL